MKPRKLRTPAHHSEFCGGYHQLLRPQTLFVHTNGPFLLTAVLPGTPTVLAPLHPPGLGQGERAVR
jgi:hypothetical protein